jgi:hypothetical protein
MKDVKPEIWHHYLGNGSRWQNPLVIVPSKALPLPSAEI